MAKTQTPAPVATATEPATTVDGFAMQVLAFIPVPRKDLKKQVEISTLLIDINEGRKTVADLVPFMKNVEFRQQHVRKRFTVAEVNAWARPAADDNDDAACSCRYLKA